MTWRRCPASCSNFSLVNENSHPIATISLWPTPSSSTLPQDTSSLASTITPSPAIIFALHQDLTLAPPSCGQASPLRVDFVLLKITLWPDFASHRVCFWTSSQENFKVTISLDNCFKGICICTYRELCATFCCHLSLFSIYGSK